MSEVFKNFKSGEKKITTTATHKQWNIDATNSSSLGINSYLGRYYPTTYTWNLEDPLQGSDPAEVLAGQPDGNTNTQIYYKQIFDSINHLYYEGGDNPYDVFCNDHPSKNTRDLSNFVSVISIPSTIFGEKIKPGTFGWSSSAFQIQDDGYGNVFDPDDYSGSIAKEIEDNCIFYLPFSDSWKVHNSSTPKLIPTSSLRVESNGNFKARAYNLSYSDPSPVAAIWGSYPNFHGSQSLQETHSIENPSDNAVVVIEGTKGYEVPDHWALSLYIKIPSEQAVTSSYTGPRQNDREDRLRELQAKSNNTIITSREWWGHNMPFELNIINQSHGDDGKLQFEAKSKTEGEAGIQIKSSTLVNDAAWHHVFILAANDEVKLYLDGTQEGGTSTYSYKNKNTRLDADIHIGARPLSYKTKYYESGSQRMVHNKKNKNYIKAFSGSVDQVRFYDLSQQDSDTAISITPEMINCISESCNQTNNVGNIFYDHGIATVTTPLYGKTNHANYVSPGIISAVNATMSFQGTHLIKEHLYICNILDGEFNATYNITARQNNDPGNDNLQAYTTHSEFNPYITSIGLYNDQNELLAVGKLAQPVKNQDDYDNTFQIRFDTTI